MMDLNPTRQAAVLVARPAGHIDQVHADDFLAALRAALERCKAEGTALLVDFAAVDYISSVGLRALMLTAREAKAAGVGLAVAALRPLVQELAYVGPSTYGQSFTVVMRAEPGATGRPDELLAELDFEAAPRRTSCDADVSFTVTIRVAP